MTNKDKLTVAESQCACFWKEKAREFGLLPNKDLKTKLTSKEQINDN